ncbi:MAG: SGNH/GDSL hydrolase family protein, partial [Planctomycetota bacterium]
MGRRFWTAALVSLGLAGPASAGTIPGGFSSLTIYGDSFSDTGNTRDFILNATGGLFTYPSASGRYTEGRNYVDFLAEDFGLTQNVDLFNFAFGGAKAASNPADAILDFGEQINISAPLAPVRGPNPLGAVFFGGNDIIEATFAAGGSAALGISGIAGDETNPAAVLAAKTVAIQGGVAAANAILSTLALFGTGSIDTYLLFNLPDVGAAPRFADPNPIGTNPDTGGSTAEYATI